MKERGKEINKRRGWTA